MNNCGINGFIFNIHWDLPINFLIRIRLSRMWNVYTRLHIWNEDVELLDSLLLSLTLPKLNNLHLYFLYL